MATGKWQAAISAFVCLIASACATAPLQVPVQKTAVIPLPKDEVWGNVIEFFASNNIAIKTIEKESGIVYAERSAGGANSLSEWASCGSDAMSPAVRESVDLNVFVRDANPGTSVTINAAFREIRKNGWTGALDTVDCNSLGTLETQLLRVAAGRP